MQPLVIKDMFSYTLYLVLAERLVINVLRLAPTKDMENKGICAP